MPRPGSPMSHASASWNSTSDDAFERLPSLSLRRLICTDLRVKKIHRRAPRLRGVGGIDPRRAMLADGGRKLHQRIPRRMELDLIDTLAARIVRAQARRVAIGRFRQRERFGAAERFAPAF